jgi:hypothetical protein
MRLRIIILLVTLIVMLSLSLAGASDIDSRGSGRAGLLSWSPPVVDYMYVNDTVNRTVIYSITTSGQMAVHAWNKRDTEFHTLICGVLSKMKKEGRIIKIKKGKENIIRLIK